MFLFRFICLTFLSSFAIISTIIADEGMWVPLILGQTCYQQMKEEGCRLSPEDLYSINHASIKDAVVLFDRGCSGVIVSDQGLLFTNHHCGFKAIQNHSSREQDYLTLGFWAMSQQEELPNPSLTVSLLIRMEDVTSGIIKGITDTTREIVRNRILLTNIDAMEKAETRKTPSHRIVIKPLYNGNQYFLFEYEVFQDIRLVAAPPTGIGKYGGDSDNWIWPRHTGEFSVFRIYADKNNQPAPYSPDNVPYKPKKYIPISLHGINDNDFTIVYGYPAFVQPFLTSDETGFLVKTELPQLINLRIQRLTILSHAMESDSMIRSQYSPQYYGLSSTWKKWQGELRGLTLSDAVNIKKEQESALEQWINRDENRKEKYGKLLDQFHTVFPEYAFYSLVNSYGSETFQSIEMLDIAGKFNNFIRNASWDDSTRLRKELTTYRNGLVFFYKHFNKKIDQQMFAVLMQMYDLHVDPRFQPDIFQETDKKFKGDFTSWAKEVYTKSVFANPEQFLNDLDHITVKKAKMMLKDPAIIIYQSFGKVFNDSVIGPFSRYTILKDSLYRVYTAALMEKNRALAIYPEANQTLRISFGKVQGYHVADAVDFLSYTTLEGIMQKDDSTSYDYHVPKKLKNLYVNKDYGPYADEEGKMRICFIATNHTAGGNSGSPVLNAYGELVGLNFDRNWEGTMNEVLYNPALCRNISVDIRYVLFVIDKFGGAGYLLKEMNIIKD